LILQCQNAQNKWATHNWKPSRTFYLKGVVCGVVVYSVVVSGVDVESVVVCGVVVYSVVVSGVDVESVVVCGVVVYSIVVSGHKPLLIPKHQGQLL
jgi:hypothetical protein